MSLHASGARGDCIDSLVHTRGRERRGCAFTLNSYQPGLKFATSLIGSR